ncbi:MAG: ribosome hibernation-promoting factor, HPF/YfiA family [Christensenellales bacterium]
MRIIITGKNMEVSDYLKDVAEKKLGKLGKYFNPDTDVQVTMSTQRGRHLVEVTIPFNGMVIRGEESTGDMYASIDNVIDKLERQIERYRTKLGKRIHQDAFSSSPVYPEEEKTGEVVRYKRFIVKPMSVEEAIMQIELLGHEFFVFMNDRSGKINVLYKRKYGGYGLIEPDYL